MAAASVSPTAKAPVIDSAATMSSPRSPRRRLVTISTSSASSTGTVTAAQIVADQAPRPASLAAKPAARPSATSAARNGRAFLSALAIDMADTSPLQAGAAMTKIKCRRAALWT